MDYGVQFFPDDRRKSGAAYFSDALALAEDAETCSLWRTTA
jgi:hypothetical protein